MDTNKTKYPRGFDVVLKLNMSQTCFGVWDMTYNNSTSSMSLVCNPSYNITSPIDLSNNFPSLNNHGIPFLWTIIEKLPSFSRFDTILVIIDQLTKQVIFIPTHDTITSTDLAHLFVLHVFSKHSVPFHVTSHRDSVFVSSFFQSLGTALNM